MIDYLSLPRNDMAIIDMRSFYASVEAVHRGLDPMEVYLAVVGDKSRSGSIVLAASPKMKLEYGIKTGSRLFEIPTQDPRIIIAEARMEAYLRQSVELTRLFTKYVPMNAIHTYSVDEAFLFIGPSARLFGDKWEMAHRIRQDILSTMSLPSAVGLGPSKLLSKLALDLEAKKTGIAEWDYEDVKTKLWPTDIIKMWGIGSRLEKRLHSLGIYKVGHIAQCPIRTLKKHFGIMGEQLYYHAWGVDLSPVTGVNYIADEQSQKGVGSGITLLRDYRTEEVSTIISELSSEVATRLRKLKAVCRTLSLGIGYSRDVMAGGFNRSKTIDNTTNIDTEIYATCIQLFRDYDIGADVRNVHVSVSNLEKQEARQLSLFEDIQQSEKKMKLGYVMDEINQRYGAAAIFRANSLTNSGIALKRAGQIGGHSK